MGELGVQAGTGYGQGLQIDWSFEGTVDQHAAGCMRGFAARFAALDYQNLRAVLAQSDCERESDDAPADDDYVPGLHPRIVKEAETRGGDIRPPDCIE